MKRVTLKDIANELGVSKSLVSCVVNDMPDGHWNITVRPELRAKIKATAKEMGYRPHRHAKALREGAENTIGIITPVSLNPITSLRLLGFVEGIQDKGYDSIIQQISYSNMSQLNKAINLLVDYNVKGIILSDPGYEHNYIDDLRELANNGMPVVDICVVSRGDSPSVSPDFYAANYEMTRQMIENGHRDIWAIYPPDIMSSYSIKARLSGIKDACAEYEDVRLRVHSNEFLPTYSDMEDGYRRTMDIIGNDRPDFIFYSNDYTAIGGLRALKEKGIRVPGDVCICGFDGIEHTNYTSPSISTIEQPSKEVAAKAVEILYDMIEKRMPISKVIYKIPCKSIFRESTGILKQSRSK